VRGTSSTINGRSPFVVALGLALAFAAPALGKRRARQPPRGMPTTTNNVVAQDASVPAAASAESSPSPARDCRAPFLAAPNPPTRPPFSGSAYISGAIITEADPTSFAALEYQGRADRRMFDRRTARFQVINAHIFDARFGASTHVEVQVNPEFARDEAEREARSYAAVIGRLPSFLFRDLRTVWIHRGDLDWGGGNNNLMIHTGRHGSYASRGVVEEILLHEATHTSLDSEHRASPRWREAQIADHAWISDYARDNPEREDLAETVSVYLAQRFRADRLPAATIATIRATIGARIAYLDCAGLTMSVLR